MVQILAYQHLREQPSRRDALVDDVRGDGRLQQRLALRADPLAAHVALDAEHPRAVVELLGNILADALEGAAAGTGGALGLMVDLPARQVRRQCLAFGLLLLALRGRHGREFLQLTLHRRQVSVDGLFQQALLLGIEGLGLGGELQSLEHGHLVRELVDGGLLERDLVVATSELKLVGCRPSPQAEDHLAQLLRVQVVKVGRVDHGR